MNIERLILMIVVIFTLVTLWIPPLILLYILKSNTKTSNIITKKKLSYIQEQQIENLQNKLNDYYDELDENPELEEDPTIISKIMESIDLIENDYGITKEEISLGNDILNIIDNLISFYALENTAKQRLTGARIEIIHVDKIVQYVADSTMNSLKKEFFLAKTPYTEEFLISYIAKKSKLYVLSSVMSYNTGMTLE